MPDMDRLLALAKSIAYRAGTRIVDSLNEDNKRYTHCIDLPKEIKSIADHILNQDILKSLAPLGIPILSEESGYLYSKVPSDYRFIVDPLDGTYNFVRDLGPSAVSIALWNQQTPVFGVIYSMVERELIWGGRGLGAFADDSQIAVSDTLTNSTAAICTGFPVRFELENSKEMEIFYKTIKSFAKVRMIGSAAMSLLYVARGSADAYFERNIMIWDVAAGLAIVQGAGGTNYFTQNSTEHSLNVFSSNGHIFHHS